MDLLFLPKTVEKNLRVGARFAFRSYSAPKPGSFQYGGFYYIGKNTAHIDKLVQMYKRGYASEGMDNMKAELLRSLEQEKNILPEVIFCEAKFDLDEIRKLKQFLRQHPVLNSIPLILDGSGLSDKELEMYRAYARPDEILFLQHADEKGLKLKKSFSFGGSKRRNRHRCRRILRIKCLPAVTFGTGLLTKRAFDILVASLALLILGPLFLLIALAIRLESRGPIFYIAKRAGRGYKIFNFYKFRTMYQGADKKMSELTHLNQYNAETKGPVFFKINNDPRITRIGTFLRNTSLDELPQLVNVFLGDMSLVGNRPLPLVRSGNTYDG